MSTVDMRTKLESFGHELEAATVRSAQRSERRHRGARITALSVGAVLVASGTITAVSELGGRRADVARARTAAEILGRAAAAAPDQHVGPGQFYYQQSDFTNVFQVVAGRRHHPLEVPPKPGERTYTTLWTDHRELWLSARHSGRELLEVPRTPGFPSEQDRRLWKRAGLPNLLGSRPGRHESHSKPGDKLASNGDLLILQFVLQDYGLTPGGLVRLSYDQARFNRVVYARARRVVGLYTGRSKRVTEHRRNTEVFHFVTTLLERWDGPMPVTLRVGLYRLAATVPQATAIPEIHDHAGRKGIGVRLGKGRDYATLIFDPKTFQLLESQNFFRPGNPTYLTFIRSGVVGSTSELPLDQK